VESYVAHYCSEMNKGNFQPLWLTVSSFKQNWQAIKITDRVLRLVASLI